MEIKIDIQGLDKLQNIIKTLSPEVVRRWTVVATNETGAKAKTAVKRTLARQTGLSYSAVEQGLVVRKAWAGQGDEGAGAIASYTIQGSGRPIPMREYKPREVRGGVTAMTVRGGGREFHPRHFIRSGWTASNAPKRGRRRSAGQGESVFSDHVMVRTGPKQTPIEKAFGPSIAEAMVEGAVVEAFERVAQTLPDRLAHHLYRAMG